jgi:pimeloyl-ACP methyl ester carboxylesterase
MCARSRSVAALVALIGVTILGACSRGDALRSEAVAASEPVTFDAPDGTELAGRLFGPPGADAGIVFAHMAPSDQTAWYTDAARAGGDGLRALTFDFRGYCPGSDGGCSAGDKDVTAVPSDLAAAVAYLRSTGVQHVAIVGASMGGTGALNVAATDPEGIDAVVAISAPVSFSGLNVSPETLSALTSASLFIAGNGDGAAADAAQQMFNAAGQPKRVEIVTSDDHGTDLLTGNAGGRVRDAMDQWLAQYLRAGEVASP